ncbi:MAG: T9SS type A sorting domain-containing protein, partial [Saprospiraceae bacterium]|nr:T9SS type A sorting domain-containing protein [Saprospiraceae bacterium]
ENSTYEYGIMDLAGKVMLRNVIDAQSGIDISSMKPGMYFVQILKDNIPECVRKIVILK